MPLRLLVLCCVNAASQKAKAPCGVLCTGRTGEGGGYNRIVGTETHTALEGKTTHMTTLIRITSVVARLRNVSVPCSHNFASSSTTRAGNGADSHLVYPAT